METSQVLIALSLAFLAGLATGLGSIISLFIKKLEKSYLSFGLGFSAGVMIYVSFAELLSSAIKDIGFLKANAAFFIGIIFIMLIDFAVPHEYLNEHVKLSKKNKKIMMAGLFTALGIAIHNFPEGLAVFVSSLKSIHLGLSLAFAIAVHNIPEGIAVSMPIYYATKSRKKAFFYSFMSGLAEPVGALIGIIFLIPFLNAQILSFILALVAGIMIFISFDELLPLSYDNGQGHVSIFGVIIGMALMALSLYLF